MNYACEILADSANPNGDRLTTFEITFPRMVLADITRHRMLSYSIESTRAVPVEKRIEMVRDHPFVPMMRERATGMGRGALLGGEAQRFAEQHWIKAAHAAAYYAQDLLHTEKGLVGRLLEPFSWVTGIISGTEWENFFALRCDEGAQMELQIIAEMMRDAYDASTPSLLQWGQWHLPLISEQEHRGIYPMIAPSFLAGVSAGRCAAVSYARHAIDEAPGVSHERWEKRLRPAAHWSPAEHPAMAHEGRAGNFTGFQQLRKFYPGESIKR